MYFSIDVLDLPGFQVWTHISRIWAYAAAAFIIIIPFYQEVFCSRESILNV